MAVGRCVDLTVPDITAPVLLAASAVDVDKVILDFSERLNPTTVSAETFTLAPSLAIADFEVAENLRQIVLTTAVQQPGVTYVVGVGGVSDLRGNVMATIGTSTFDGFGPSPDRDPPRILAPSSTEVTVVPAAPDVGLVTLVWTRRALARSYTVEVAYDAAFTRLVNGYPVTVDDPASSLTRELSEAVRYYWRVRANTTREGEYAESQFDRLRNTLHVYCPAGSICNDRDANGHLLPGNASAPLQTLSGAVIVANALSLRRVRVAARGDDEPYREHVLAGGVSFFGGYDASFDESSRNRGQHPTIVASDAREAFAVFGGSDEQTIGGFVLRSAGGTALRVSGGSAVVVEDNAIVAGNAGIDVNGVDFVYIRNNVLQSQPATTGGGVRIGATQQAVLENNSIAIASCGGATCQDALGVSAEDVSFLQLLRNTITVETSLATSRHRGVEVRDVGLQMSGNRVTTGDGNTVAVSLTWSKTYNPSYVVNNILMSGATTTLAEASTALAVIDPDLGSSRRWLAVANNLMYAGGGPGTAAAVTDSLIGTSYVNNIMLTGAGAAAYCFRETRIGGPRSVYDFRNNLLLGCTAALYRYQDPTPRDLTSIADVNALTSVGIYRDNATLPNVATVAFADFPADLRLTATTPAVVRYEGLDVPHTTCDGSSCGVVLDDFAGTARTCTNPGVECYSMGPYEYVE